MACQGDTFKGVLDRIRMIAALAQGTEAGEEADYLAAEVHEMLELYVATLTTHGIDLPWGRT